MQVKVAIEVSMDKLKEYMDEYFECNGEVLTIEQAKQSYIDQFIADKTVKDKIIQNFEPMCVEMEGAAIAHACTVNAIPFVIIRCLSDCADDSVNSVYSFNEETCAKMCADFVENFVNNL